MESLQAIFKGYSRQFYLILQGNIPEVYQRALNASPVDFAINEKI